ncbi:MAG: SH3 domain-containing protein, partial [Lachnospiraceae bacterium]|nr:SH3 domain-containing protein [Lachnospiraceae bacterium]
MMRKLFCSLLLIMALAAAGAVPAEVSAASDGIAGSGGIVSEYEDMIENRREAVQESEADGGELVSEEEAAEIQIELAKEGSLENLIQKFDNLGIASIENGYLNIREKPEEDAKVIGKMVGNDVCDIKETVGDWYHI